MATGTVVIGVGNAYRRDDGAGPAVIAALRAQGLRGVRLEDSDGEPTKLIDLWSGAHLAILVDAARTDDPVPGRIHRRSMLEQSRHLTAGASSHRMDLGDTIALASALDSLPDELVIFLVEVSDTGYGEQMNPPVAAAVDELVGEIVEEIAHRASGRS